MPLMGKEKPQRKEKGAKRSLKTLAVGQRLLSKSASLPALSRESKPSAHLLRSPSPRLPCLGPFQDGP